MAIIKCPNCNENISDNSIKCIHCNYLLSKNNQNTNKYCSSCGNQINDNMNFCKYCGNKNNSSTSNESISQQQTIHQNYSNSKQMTCPNCGSTNIQVQIVSENKGAGCFTILLCILFAWTIIGLIILIKILGNKSVNKKYYICQTCGKTFNSNWFDNPLDKNNKKIMIALVIAIVVLIIGACLNILTKNTDYVDFDQYKQLDVQKMHNDYLDNKISAEDKYENKYYYFSGEIYKIEEFLTDKYIILKYKSKRDKSKTIELDAYFNSYKELLNVKKGDKITIYCKFDKQTIENYYNITSYSLHSCRFKDK